MGEVWHKEGACGDCYALSSPRSSFSAQYEARGLPSLLCASSDTGRWRRWRPFRVELPSLVSLSTKHVGFSNLGVQALVRGGGYAGDCFASCPLVRPISLGPERSAWASGTPVRELRHKEATRLATDLRQAQGGGYAGECFASSSPPSRLLTSRLSVGKERSTRASATVALEPGYKKRIRWHLSCVDLPSVVNISSERSTLASVTSVRELWHEEVDTPAIVLHQAPLAHRPQLSSKRVGFHYHCE